MRAPGAIPLVAAVLSFWLAPCVHAQTATFDLDTGTPPLFAGQGLGFSQTSGGVTATFSSPQGPAFSVQTDGTTHYRMSQFSGNYLWPNSIYRNALDIRFDRPIVGVTLTFATVDYPDNAEIPADLQLAAYDASTGTLIGTASAHGSYLGDTYPMGTLSFVSAGPPFDFIELVVPAQPQGTTAFLADNFTVTTLVVPPLEVSGPASATPLAFTTQEDLIWEDAAASHAASFNLYRGDTASLRTGSYGLCLLAGVPSSFGVDPGSPAAGRGWFYVVTARNALGEGTMGADSSGWPRANGSPCP
jgi:hypothetical protein